MSCLTLMVSSNRWASTRVFTPAVAGLDDDAYGRDRGAFFGSIQRTLNHLLPVDRLWSIPMRQRESVMRSSDQVPFEEFEALKQARIEEDEKIIALVDGLSDAQLEAPLRCRRIIDDSVEEVRAGHILSSPFNHQTHHRDQVHALLPQAGVTPPPLGLLFYLDEIGATGPRGRIKL